MKTNLREMDFLRAIAALAVIAIHVTSSQYYTNKFAYVWDTIMCFAVPVFIIISGYLLHHSNKEKKNLNYFEFLKRRLSKIIIPYLVWTLIYMIYSYNLDLVRIFSIDFLAKLTESIALGRGYVHLYFMVIIIQLYFIYPMLRYFILKNEKLTLVIAFVISYYFQIEAYFSQHGINLLPAFGKRYYFILFARWVFYFVLGMYVVQNRERVTKVLVNIKVDLAIVWVLVATFLISVSMLFKNGNPLMYPIIIVYTLSCFFVLYSVCYCFRETGSKVGRLLEWFSKQSFIVYLSHLILMQLVLMKLRSIIGINIWGRSIGLILYFIATVLISAVFAYLASFTPISQWLGGVRDKKRSLFQSRSDIKM